MIILMRKVVHELGGIVMLSMLSKDCIAEVLDLNSLAERLALLVLM